jgi:hypothetical protein
MEIWWLAPITHASSTHIDQSCRIVANIHIQNIVYTYTCTGHGLETSSRGLPWFLSFGTNDRAMETIQ